LNQKKPAFAASQSVNVRLGQQALVLGDLIYTKAGPREFSNFAYSDAWLAHPDRFMISPDLELTPGFKPRKALTKHDSCFPFAFADTEPDAWGRRVINRAHAKARKEDKSLAPLTELDYLTAVDDFSRIGALRLCDKNGQYLRTEPEGKRTTPPLLELERIYAASQAVERSSETAEDLRYLQGKGTSLGGMRPKCTVIDADGSLAIGKFPSVKDERDVPAGQGLGLKLAGSGKFDVAGSRIVVVNGSPVALIKRFDRTADGSRIHYLSVGSMLQAERDNEHSYVEVVDRMRAICRDPVTDTKELWRRLVFNLLITNVDDHLHNLGFLYAGGGLWELAPAFDLNPFPDKDRESKTPLSDSTGTITDIAMLMSLADYFYLENPEAIHILGEVYAAVTRWKSFAVRPDIGLKPADLSDFSEAFEHAALEDTATMLGY